MKIQRIMPATTHSMKDALPLGTILTVKNVADQKYIVVGYMLIGLPIPSLLTITTTVLRHGIPIAHMQSTAVRTLTSLNRNLPPMTQRIPMQSTVFWMSAASQKQDTKPAIAGKLGPKTVP